MYAGGACWRIVRLHVVAGGVDPGRYGHSQAAEKSGFTGRARRRPGRQSVFREHLLEGRILAKGHP